MNTYGNDMSSQSSPTIIVAISTIIVNIVCFSDFIMSFETLNAFYGKP